MNVGRWPYQLQAWGLLSTPVQYAARPAVIATRSKGSSGRRRDERSKKIGKKGLVVAGRHGDGLWKNSGELGFGAIGAIERIGNARNICVLQ